MPDIADLAIKISANTAGLVAGMTLADKQIKEFKARLDTLRTSALALNSAFDVAWAGVVRDVEAVRSLSNATGVSTERLEGLRLAFRNVAQDASHVGPVLLSLERTMQQATLGNHFAQQSLGRGGVSGGDSATALLQVAQQFEGIIDPAQRAALAYRLFHDEAASALAVLSQGSAALTDAQGRADALGLSFSRFDAQGLRQANESLNRISDIFTGITRQVVIQLAPVVERIGDMFNGWVQAAGGIRPLVNNIVQALLRAVAAIMDMIHSARQLINGLRNNAQDPTGLRRAGSAVGSFFRGHRPQSSSEWFAANGGAPTDIGPSPGNMIREFADNLAQQSQNPFQSLWDAITQTAQHILQRDAALMREGEQLANTMRTPLEMFQADMTRLQSLRDSGYIDQQTFGRAASAGVGRLLSGESSIPQLAGAATVNSSEAGAAIARFSAGFFDPVDTIARLNEQQLQVAERQAEIADRLLQNMRNLNTQLGADQA